MLALLLFWRRGLSLAAGPAAVGSAVLGSYVLLCSRIALGRLASRELSGGIGSLT